MHFEFLVEDVSGKTMLNILVPKIFGTGTKHTFKYIHYKGIGKIAKNLHNESDPQKRQLLSQLPKLLQGYGNSLKEIDACVVVVCDLDKRCLKQFREELLDLLNKCNPRPETFFCIAIKEGEAWLLGDTEAVVKAYPKAKKKPLNEYKNDSICGTWEILADAIYRGGSKKLAALGWQAVGKEKSEWAQQIAPHIDIEENKSPSFCYFRDKIRDDKK